MLGGLHFFHLFLGLLLLSLLFWSCSFSSSLFHCLVLGNTIKRMVHNVAEVSVQDSRQLVSRSRRFQL